MAAPCFLEEDYLWEAMCQMYGIDLKRLYGKSFYRMRDGISLRRAQEEAAAPTLAARQFLHSSGGRAAGGVTYRALSIPRFLSPHRNSPRCHASICHGLFLPPSHRFLIFPHDPSWYINCSLTARRSAPPPSPSADLTSSPFDFITPRQIESKERRSLVHNSLEFLGSHSLEERRKKRKTPIVSLFLHLS